MGATIGSERSVHQQGEERQREERQHADETKKLRVITTSNEERMVLVGVGGGSRTERSVEESIVIHSEFEEHLLDDVLVASYEKFTTGGQSQSH
jgi:hypothetical protein